MPNKSIEMPTSLEEKIGQLINVRIGSNLPPVRTVDADAERIAQLIKSCPIGGLTLFNGVWPTTRDVLEHLQSLATTPLLVGSDIERGCGQQVHGVSVLPHAGAFGAASSVAEETNPSLAYEFGKATAIEARLAGIQIAFGPVADTNTNPRNPIIATRAFGTDPGRVSRLVADYVRGCESQQVATSAKHFPGHGDTEQDSHDSLPQLGRDQASIRSTELPPFVAAIDAGCSIVMTAHVAYPAFDPSGLPATLSAPILKGLLRESLGFEGIICSDSLLMSGVRDRFDHEGELCLAALNAGIDWLLDVADPIGVIDYLVKCVRDGLLDESTVDESASRIIALKQRVCQPLPPQSDFEIQRESILQLGQRVATQAIDSFQSSPTVTLDRTKPTTCLLAKPFVTSIDPPEQPLGKIVRQQFDQAEYFELTPEVDSSTIEAARQSATSSEQVILAMIVKPAAWHKFGLLDDQLALFQELAKLPNTVVVSLGVPGILDKFSESAPRFCAFSDVPVSQAAIIQRLLGISCRPA
ncbi:glycoside hydrolase family 3 protein [Aeoliella mucimassa]|uniref:beta-N-acetylhexosaminidase n=1 Tax=Aeoliella mucimassa TaxID=2527972 RepID=A0A518AS85_9BACT|nr:glycoside hydrolase family 3 N-terminal domain-containing protein [Aeoliella mucimassa]QDU57578.1 putative lipoprotein YbbD precursor [Aeoliella mucimassa]